MSISSPTIKYQFPKCNTPKKGGKRRRNHQDEEREGDNTHGHCKEHMNIMCERTEKNGWSSSPDKKLTTARTDSKIWRQMQTHTNKQSKTRAATPEMNKSKGGNERKHKMVKTITNSRRTETKNIKRQDNISDMNSMMTARRRKDRHRKKTMLSTPWIYLWI